MPAVDEGAPRPRFTIAIVWPGRRTAGGDDARLGKRLKASRSVTGRAMFQVPSRTGGRERGRWRRARERGLPAAPPKKQRSGSRRPIPPHRQDAGFADVDAVGISALGTVDVRQADVEQKANSRELVANLFGRPSGWSIPAWMSAVRIPLPLPSHTGRTRSRRPPSRSAARPRATGAPPPGDAHDAAGHITDAAPAARTSSTIWSVTGTRLS